MSTNVNPLPKNVREEKGLEGNKMILYMWFAPVLKGWAV